MAFNYSLVAFLFVLLSTSSEAACNFKDVFTFGVGKASVASDGIVLPRFDEASNQIKDTTFGALETFIMHQDFLLRHGIQLLEDSSSLDSQIAKFLDFLGYTFLEDRVEKLRNTLVIVNQPGLVDYKHALEVSSEVHVLDFVPEVVAEIKNDIRRLIHAGVSNIVVSGLKPRALFGLETLANLHRNLLYYAVVELRVEFPEVHISHIDYVRMSPKGKDHLFANLEVSEACKSFLEREGHLL